jgi:hypothetical protein
MAAVVAVAWGESSHPSAELGSLVVALGVAGWNMFQLVEEVRQLSIVLLDSSCGAVLNPLLILKGGSGGKENIVPWSLLQHRILE